MAKKQIVIKYIFKDDYNPIYATGAFGGVNPSGDIIANFYLERHALPKEMTYDLDGPEPKPISDRLPDFCSFFCRYVTFCYIYGARSLLLTDFESNSKSMLLFYVEYPSVYWYGSISAV